MNPARQTAVTHLCSVSLSRRKKKRSQGLLSSQQHINSIRPLKRPRGTVTRNEVCATMCLMPFPFTVLSLLPLYLHSGCQAVSGGGLSGTTWRNPIVARVETLTSDRRRPCVRDHALLQRRVHAKLRSAFDIPLRGVNHSSFHHS